MCSFLLDAIQMLHFNNVFSLFLQQELWEETQYDLSLETFKMQISVSIQNSEYPSESKGYPLSIFRKQSGKDY